MKKLLLLSLAAVALLAQTPGPNHWNVGLAVVPASPSVVVSPSSPATSVYLDKLVLANTTANVVTVLITDNSTRCNGSACQLFPSVSMPANTFYTVDLLGVRMSGGISWSASTANAVNGAMQGRY